MVQNLLSKGMEMVSGWLYPSPELDSLLGYMQNKDATLNPKNSVNLWHSWTPQTTSPPISFIYSQKV